MLSGKAMKRARMDTRRTYFNSAHPKNMKYKNLIHTNNNANYAKNLFLKFQMSAGFLKIWLLEMFL